MQVHPFPQQAEEDPPNAERVQPAPGVADQINEVVHEAADGDDQAPGQMHQGPDDVAHVAVDDPPVLAGNPPPPPQGLKNYTSWTEHAKNVKIFREKRRNDIEALKLQTTGLAKVTVDNIVNKPMMDLRNMLQNGQLNAVDVVSAYVKRAIEVDEWLNCITQMMNDPIEVARQLDEKEEKGPLFGLPFSIKSNFHVEGYPATIGLAEQLKLENFPTTTCALVQFLIDQGAVPICLTNVPQGLLAYVTSNPLHGTTKNPWDFSRTPGGSSGGEAALLAAGGAAFGIGNDLVGSLRIPAAFCGLVSLKPTQNRIPETGMHAGPESRGCLGLSSGFFTKTVEEQYFLLKTLVGCNGLEAENLREIEFNQPKQPKPVIAYFSNDGFNPVVPSNKTAVEDTITKLETLKEFTVKPVELSEICGDPYELAELLFKNVMPDNGASMNKLYSNEETDKNMKDFTFLLRIKQYKIVNWLASCSIIQFFIKLTYSTRFACLARSVNPAEQAVDELKKKVDIFKQKWNAVWDEKRYHALICPAFITPAQPFSFPAKLATGTFSTGLFNMLDVPAGIVPVDPVTAVDADLANQKTTYFAGIFGDKLLFRQNTAAAKSKNLPNAVQVVARTEEDCLYVMKRIEELNTGVQKLVWNGVPTTKKKVESEDLFTRVNKIPQGSSS